MPHVEIIVILIHCNIFKNDYQHSLRALFTFVPNKSFSHILNISLKYFILLKNFKSTVFVYWDMIYWSKSKALEIKHKTNIALVFIWSLAYKNDA